MNKVARLAALLAANGVAAFPCGNDKAPLCPGGYKAATADSAEVTLLWRHYPGSLIGVPTGQVSGFDVVDIDPRNGGNEWYSVNQQRLPITRTHNTRSGRLHILYKHHAGLRNSVGKIALGVDVRADGGYIIWWPGIGLAVQNHNHTAEWPEWILAAALPKAHTPQPVIELPQAGADRYAAAALRHAIEAVATAGEGSRNHILNREAFGMLRFVLCGTLKAEQIASALAAAALAAGLGRNEVITTLSSAMRARGIA